MPQQVESDFATTTRTLRNTHKTLSNRLEQAYGITDPAIAEKLLKMHGLFEGSFDYLKTIDEIISANTLNDISIDPNSNKGEERYIESVIQEAISPIKKAIGFNKLYCKMKDMYGQDDAVNLLSLMLDYTLGLSDSTNIMKPYCWSFNASLYVTGGKEFGALKLPAPETMGQYISGLCEIVHEFAANIAGALAIGSFFLDIAHLALYKEKIDLRELRTSSELKKHLEEKFLQFINSCNQLSRNSIESPFTNISLFDRIKLRKKIVEMDYYFPLDKLPIQRPLDVSDEDLKDYLIDYLVDYITEIQNRYLDVFDKGNLSANGMPYRFPVTTINLTIADSKGVIKIQDLAFLNAMVKREIFRYNIFVSAGDKTASCCRLINNNEMLELAGQANSFGAGGSLSLGSHRVITLNTVRMIMEAKTSDEFFEILKTRINDCARILKAHKHLIYDLNDAGLQPFIRNGWIDMKRMFSTFGIIGIYETAEIHRKKFGNGFDIEGKILTTIDAEVNDITKNRFGEFGIVGNIEQIPGESFAVRLAVADKLILGEDNPLLVDYKLYSNQFLPQWHPANVWERLEADGKYNKLVTGGGIVHATIGEKPNTHQAIEIIKYAVRCGCEHFALNAIYSKCVSGHMSFGDNSTCPICSGNIVDKVTRVVGFYTSVAQWGPVRRTHDFPNRTKVDLSIPAPTAAVNSYKGI